MLQSRVIESTTHSCAISTCGVVSSRQLTAGRRLGGEQRWRSRRVKAVGLICGELYERRFSPIDTNPPERFSLENTRPNASPSPPPPIPLPIGEETKNQVLGRCNTCPLPFCLPLHRLRWFSSPESGCGLHIRGFAS